MEIRTLKSFVAVARMKSFSAAARELNTVQPAISRHIADLEEELGAALFWRNTREVKITAAGNSLLADAEKILANEVRAKERALRAAAGETGTLSIAYLASASFVFLPNLIRKYSKLYPDVHVTLTEMSVREQLEAFSKREIDIGISRPFSRDSVHDLSSLKLYTDVLTVLVPSHHPVFKKQKMAAGELSGENFILFNRDDAPCLFDQIIQLCTRSGFSPMIRSMPDSMQTVLTEVASGLGISIVPGCIRYLYARGCDFIELTNEGTEIATELHYMKQQSSPAAEAFVALTYKEGHEILKNTGVT